VQLFVGAMRQRECPSRRGQSWPVIGQARITAPARKLLNSLIHRAHHGFLAAALACLFQLLKKTDPWYGEQLMARLVKAMRGPGARITP